LIPDTLGADGDPEIYDSRVMDANLLHAEGNMTLTLKSNAFEKGDVIPSKYTCEGEDISPPLIWAGVPETARSLVLIVDDPDVQDPKAPKITWVHRVLYNIRRTCPVYQSTSCQQSFRRAQRKA
jgi:phosphatidylethanolamine-binding protein (PEBP) family uncharacterized protein